MIALAVPITVTGTGQITISRDDMNLFGLGTGTNTILCASITASWTFDTDNAGPDQQAGDPQQAHYRPSTDWVDSSLNIDTSTVDTSTVDSTFSVDDLVTDEDRFFDHLFLQNEAGGGDGFDRYYDLDYERDDSSYEYAYSLAQIYSHLDDLISSFDPGQTLSWSAGDSPSDTGTGHFRYYNGSQYSYGNYTLDTFTVTSGTSVPAPSSLIVLGLGLSGLGFRLRKKTM